jgi:hypothetical protein
MADPEKHEALPAPEDKKRQVLHLDIDLEDLFTKIPPHVTPENQSIWKNRIDMSEDYIKLNQTLQVLAMYIARACNEGPEVNNNINKRLALISTVLRVIIDNLAVTGYDAYGLLTELIQDTYMRVSGKRHVVNILAQIEGAKEQIAKEKSEEYTS